MPDYEQVLKTLLTDCRRLASTHLRISETATDRHTQAYWLGRADSFEVIADRIKLTLAGPDDDSSEM